MSTSATTDFLSHRSPASAPGPGRKPFGQLDVCIALGVLVPLAAILLERTRSFSASTQYQPLNAITIGLLVLALGKATHGDLFLAAFAAGITLAAVGQRQRESFEHFGELTTELLKLAALLVFGALITRGLLREVGWSGWAFAVLALIAARPLAIWIINDDPTRRIHLISADALPVGAPAALGRTPKCSYRR